MLDCSRRHPLCRSFPLLLVAVALLFARANIRAAEKPAHPDGHPIVAGFERFYTTSGADAAKGGRLLLGELNCISCHLSIIHI